MNLALAIAYPLLTGATMEPTVIPETLPAVIVRRWEQAERLNNRADWRQMAELCGLTAITIYRDNGCNPEHSDFKAICHLTRQAHQNAVACLTRSHRECGAPA